MKYGFYVTKHPSEVFDFVSDIDRMPEWQSSMFEVKGKQKTNAKGKLQKGSKVQDRRNVLGKQLDSEWEVVDSTQDQMLHMRVISGPALWDTVYTLEPLEGGTFLSAEGNGDLGNVPMSPFAAHRGCQRMFEQDLNTLSDILEK